MKLSIELNKKELYGVFRMLSHFAQVANQIILLLLPTLLSQKREIFETDELPKSNTPPLKNRRPSSNTGEAKANPVKAATDSPEADKSFADLVTEAETEREAKKI